MTDLSEIVEKGIPISGQVVYNLKYTVENRQQIMENNQAAADRLDGYAVAHCPDG